MNATLQRRATRAALLLAPLAFAAPAHAQLVYHGFDRVDQSDATFVSITSADMLGLEAVPARSFSCTVAWGIRDSAGETAAALSAGTLTGAAVGKAPIDPAVQQQLNGLLHGRGGADGIAAGLAPAGSTLGAQTAAQMLARRLDGLLAAAERMDPARPGVATPTRLSAALSAFDDYLDATPTAFLAQPSDEFLAVHAVLSALVTASIEHNGRPEIRATGAGGGLACALVADSRHDVPQMSTITDERRPFGECMLHPSGPLQVYGMITSSGDTLAMMDGVERPLREVYPAVRDASEFAWYHAATDPVVGGQRYVKWAMPREMLPGSIAPFAEYEGITVYAAPGVARPNAIYLPVGGCWFHEYRLARTSSAVRG